MRQLDFSEKLPPPQTGFLGEFADECVPPRRFGFEGEFPDIWMEWAGVNLLPLSDNGNRVEPQVDSGKRAVRFAKPHPLAHADSPAFHHPFPLGYQLLFDKRLFLFRDFRLLCRVSPFQAVPETRVREHHALVDGV